jgi:hypothetical protein
MPTTTADARGGQTPITEATRALLDDTVEIRRSLFDAWAVSAEAALQATFELQNAAFANGLALFDTTANSQRSAVKQWQVRSAARLAPQQP